MKSLSVNFFQRLFGYYYALNLKTREIHNLLYSKRNCIANANPKNFKRLSKSSAFYLLNSDKYSECIHCFK